ncbi:MAG: nuclear transport factor 2 family protein [Actinomycetota bacterium]|nr:nuclear transport factor 2 family protein [Actinomycetota bacterium]
MGEEQAIAATVLDYFEGWFDGDEARMAAALHPALAKRSLGDDGETLDEETTTSMIDATVRGFGKGRDPGSRDIEVRVVDVHDPIAAVVVHSNVYREYLHLVRTRAGWRIANALWRFS